eukprot:TRINITY_DN75302_c0_g1_i1.p1 TRINITY_DN75302_c0_g1~~TRINITY_DN75302_c0_g1_i1.p1  ORF type:complete len:519 (-),score=74.84 TRINITY_DN75302_c0_g1_i1:25-1581(-)
METEDGLFGWPAPSSPHELVNRFMELTGVDVATALECVDMADGCSIPLQDAITNYLNTHDIVRISHDRQSPPQQESAVVPVVAGQAEVRAKRRLLSPPRCQRPRVSGDDTSDRVGPIASPPKFGRLIPEAEARAAHDIPDGCETSFAGGSGDYRITRRGAIYTCACPSWRNQRLGPYRTCKHIKELRGDEAERQRLVEEGHTSNLDVVRSGLGSRGSATAACATRSKNTGSAADRPLGKAAGSHNPLIEKQVMLAQTWDEGKTSPTGYLMSEKLDGMRAVWDGAALWSRTGNAIAAPAYFLSALPQGFKLDGELFLGRGRFQEVMSVCRSHMPVKAAWQNVRYVIFDAPGAQGGVRERLAEALRQLGAGAGHVARVHEHQVCTGVDHVHKELQRVLSLHPPGEGLMLAAQGKPHRGGRCADILKVKKFQTNDAKVVGYKSGKGKHVGRLGALECKLRTGHRFDVGSGFADAEREDYEARYPIGCVVEFKFFELTTSGIPRFPTFLRIRPDVDPSEFPA